eukprot:1162930-Rhodomonas_salina.1
MSPSANPSTPRGADWGAPPFPFPDACSWRVESCGGWALGAARVVGRGSCMVKVWRAGVDGRRLCWAWVLAVHAFEGGERIAGSGGLSLVCLTQS